MGEGEGYGFDVEFVREVALRYVIGNPQEPIICEKKVVYAEMKSYLDLKGFCPMSDVSFR